MPGQSLTEKYKVLMLARLYRDLGSRPIELTYRTTEDPVTDERDYVLEIPPTAAQMNIGTACSKVLTELQKSVRTYFPQNLGWEHWEDAFDTISEPEKAEKAAKELAVLYGYNHLARSPDVWRVLQLRAAYVKRKNPGFVLKQVWATVYCKSDTDFKESHGVPIRSQVSPLLQTDVMHLIGIFVTTQTQTATVERGFSVMERLHRVKYGSETENLTRWWVPQMLFKHMKETSGLIKTSDGTYILSDVVRDGVAKMLRKEDGRKYRKTFGSRTSYDVQATVTSYEHAVGFPVVPNRELTKEEMYDAQLAQSARLKNRAGNSASCDRSPSRGRPRKQQPESRSASGSPRSVASPSSVPETTAFSQNIKASSTSMYPGSKIMSKSNVFHRPTTRSKSRSDSEPPPEPASSSTDVPFVRPARMAISFNSLPEPVTKPAEPAANQRPGRPRLQPGDPPRTKRPRKIEPKDDSKLKSNVYADLLKDSISLPEPHLLLNHVQTDRVQQQIRMAGVNNAALYSQLELKSYDHYTNEWIEKHGSGGIYRVPLAAVTSHVPFESKTLLNRRAKAESERIVQEFQKASKLQKLERNLRARALELIKTWRTHLDEKGIQSFVQMLLDADEEMQVEHDFTYLKNQIRDDLKKRPHERSKAKSAPKHKVQPNRSFRSKAKGADHRAG